MIMLVEFLFKIDYLLFDMCKLTVLDALNLYSITYIHLLLEVFNMASDKPKGLVGQLLNQAGPIIENRINELKEEAADEFKAINNKLDKIIELLEK